jgi:hypothetical protein
MRPWRVHARFSRGADFGALPGRLIAGPLSLSLTLLLSTVWVGDRYQNSSGAGEGSVPRVGRERHPFGREALPG